MILQSLSRHVLSRLLAVFIVVLVLSPYSEPFATMTGTDFGGAGAVDISGASKLKTVANDVLAAPPALELVLDVSVETVAHAELPVVCDSRQKQRTVLRL
jgi:hypothetical protein